MGTKCREIFVFGAAVLVSLGQPAEARELKYVGSSTLGKFMTDAKPAFQAKTGIDLVIDVGPESGGGEIAATTGTADLGGVARDPKAEALEKGAVCKTVARDAIAVILNKDNPVRVLSKSQLSGIFTGKITNWKEVGGPDQKIVAFVTEERSATRAVFQQAVLGGEEYRNVLVQTPDSAIVDKVAQLKMAIGQISFSFIIGNSAVKLVAPDGLEPSVNNQRYPIARPLNLCTKGEPKGDAKAFIDWALSPEGQAIAKKKFVGVK